MKLALSLLTLSAVLYATTHEGCSTTKKEALFTLSGNIKSNIKSDFNQLSVSDSKNDSVETTISSYLNASTNLSLVNIKYKRKDEKTICAYVEAKDQTKNAQEMLGKALLYKQENLPKDVDEKIKMLSVWIKDIKQLGFLLPVFTKDSQKSQDILNKKEKLFQDLYSDALAHSDSLVWRSCESTQEKAKKALNKKLFADKSKKEEKGFFSSITSAFSSDEPQLIELFNEQITYVKKEKKECALIKKDELLLITNSMNADVKRFNEGVLDKNPKKKYKQIENYFEHLNVTKALLALYPKTFNNQDFNRVTKVKEKLTELKKTTYPQFVMFHIKGEQGIVIKLDNKIVDNNIKHYVVNGDHSYSLTIKGKCPISGTFSTDLFDDETISEDFSAHNYPSVIFITDKTPNIVVDGKVIKPNIATPIEKCSGEVRYVVKFDGQNRSGEFSLSPNTSHSVELNFLTAKELNVFNDAKSKSFNTTSGAKFSDSLTPIASDNFEFVLKEDSDNGEVTLHEKGSFKYKSKDGFIGVDSFEYVIEANGKTSAPKIVNITVTASTAPKAAIVKKKEDLNTTVEKVKKSIKEGVEVVEKKSEELLKSAEEKYERFKTYVNSQEQNIEKLKKLQEKYPEMFNRLLKEKTGQ